MKPEQIKPQNNWVLCSPLRPREKTQKGLWIPKDRDENVRGEGVAEVIAVGPGKELPSGKFADTGLTPGDKILYRGFLRFAEQFGDKLGEGRGTDYFFLDAGDALAIVEGPGTIGGLDEEYVLEGP